MACSPGPKDMLNAWGADATVGNLKRAGELKSEEGRAWAQLSFHDLCRNRSLMKSYVGRNNF